MKVNRCFLACLYITFWGFIIPLIQTHNGEQTAGGGGGGGGGGRDPEDRRKCFEMAGNDSKTIIL